MLVKDRPILYDRKHSEYRQVEMKETIWKEISEKLNISGKKKNQPQTDFQTFLCFRNQMSNQVEGSERSVPAGSETQELHCWGRDRYQVEALWKSEIPVGDLVSKKVSSVGDFWSCLCCSWVSVVFLVVFWL